MLFHVPASRLQACDCRLCPVPPSPKLMAQLLARFNELKADGRLRAQMSFDEFYRVWRSSRRSENFVGLDDGALDYAPAGAMQRIFRPRDGLRGGAHLGAAGGFSGSAQQRRALARLLPPDAVRRYRASSPRAACASTTGR